MTTPRGDGVINVAVPYADSGQVTSTNLNDIVDDAEFNTNAVDDSSVGINGSGKLFVKDDGITTARILNSNVTLAKVANIADDRVLGNISGGAAAPSELTAAQLVTLLGTDLVNPTSVDDNTESVTFSNGLIVKFGSHTGNGSETVTFDTAFPNTIYTVVFSPRSNGGTSTTQLMMTAMSVNSFSVLLGSSSDHVNWIAIGR